MSFRWPAANQSWFAFAVQGGGPDFGHLGVYAFSGVEKICAPYEFTIELVSRDNNLDLTGMLGRDSLLTVTDKSGGKRLVHGVIRQAEQLRSGNAHTLYRVKTVPRLWFLTRTRDHRIYQHKTVPQIIEEVLDKHNFLGDSYDFQLRETYKEREYCVQYAESDYHFLARIAQEEGLLWYHEHTETGHCLYFSDTEGGPAIPGDSSLRYYQGSGHPEDAAVISRLNLSRRINSDSATHREWNFTMPPADLTGHEREPEWRKAPVPIAMELETYQFPHLYQLRKEGERYTRLQLLRQLTFFQWIECESDVSRCLPGFTFSVYGHPRGDVNRLWSVVEARHTGRQPGVLEHESPDDRGQEYSCAVTAIPGDIRYVPEVVNKKVRIEGLQSAIVTGPGGEEVYCDKYGRVKVRFHWDRLGRHDERTTCWVRVADTWAGANFGFLQLPRVGQEVMVEFMEGDPDRPVVTGRVYNAEKMPPWRLPEQKTLSGIQSREFQAARRNQLVLDDTQGEIQAQLSSDHGLSQLNLGYLTRVNHIEGRKDFRGEGFELRTDNWGVVRAKQGLYSTTHPRPHATGHHKDFSEGVSGITAAVNFHKELGELSEKHNAHILADDVSPVHADLETQKTEISGSGSKHGELSKPHVVVASAAGIASTSVESHHIHAGAHAAVTAEKNITLAAGKSLLGSFLDKICLFAHKAGVKIFAAMGKVQIQAQSDQIEILADQSVRIVSGKQKVEVAAAREILLSAGGSYIRISKDGIEQGTAGKWTAHAASHTLAGPKTHNEPMLDLPIEGYSKNIEMVFTDMYGHALKDESLALSNGSDFNLVENTDGTGKITLKNIALSSFSMIQSNRKKEE